MTQSTIDRLMELYGTATHEELKVLAAEFAELKAENERLNAALRWEQNRAGRQRTHAENCHTWGPRHYECLLGKYEELKAEKEILAQWMTENGYATGHGDTLADLVKELDWQHKELKAENEKLREVTRLMPAKRGIKELRETLDAMNSMDDEPYQANALGILLSWYDARAALNKDK